MKESGLVAEGPEFFMEALELEVGDLIYGIFDRKRARHLEIKRVFAHAMGVRQYHVEVRGEGPEQLRFRYWDVTPEKAEAVVFFVVDDTSLQMSFDWRARKLRRNIIEDLQTFFSDQLRTPLGSLRALAEVLRDRPEDSVEAAERILDAIDHVHDAVTAFDIKEDDERSEGEALPLRAKDLGRVVSSWSDKRIKVTCEVDSEIDSALFVKAAVVEDILHPVVANGIEARPRSGTVHVGIERLADKVCFEVSDDGRGMTRHELARAEDPFFTTKRGHSGLGLTVARDVLREVGGYWNYSSSRRKGTRVRIVVPAMHLEGVVSEVYEDS